MTFLTRVHAGNVGVEYEEELRLLREFLDAEERALEAWKAVAESLGVGSPEAVRLRAEWFSRAGRRCESADALALTSEDLAEALMAVEREVPRG